MIVCHCQGLTDRDIRDAARQGARTATQVGERCRAGLTCGGCRVLIDEVLRTRDLERHPSRPTRPA